MNDIKGNALDKTCKLLFLVNFIDLMWKGIYGDEVVLPSFVLMMFYVLDQQDLSAEAFSCGRNFLRPLVMEGSEPKVHSDNPKHATGFYCS